MTWQHHYRDPEFTETFPEAHAYVNISLADGSFLEFGIELKPACGPDDVERALLECETSEDFAACLFRYVQRGDGQAQMRHPEQRSLAEDEIARARRLLEGTFDPPPDMP